MSIKIVPGDILDVKEGIIVHQVNCQRVMGAGLAKAIREKYPEHYNEYRMTKPILGNAIFTDVGDGLTVAAIYGQDRYGYGDVFTDYAALEKGLKKVQAFSEQTGRQIYIPFGIGCGLAGGDWGWVTAILVDTVPDAIIVQKNKLGITVGGREI